MILYYFSLLALVLLSALVQQFMPAIPAWYDARTLVMPLVFLCCAVTVPTAWMLVLAFLSGFLWDAQHVLLLDDGDPAVLHQTPDSLKFGYTIVLYALMGFLMQGIRPLFQRGKWLFSALLTGIAIFFYLWIEFLLLSFVRGGFDFHNSTLRQIGSTSLLTMALSPLIFWILFRFAGFCNHTIVFSPQDPRRKPSKS